MVNSLPRIVIAGTHSGVGKSILATGIMYYLTEKGIKVQGFKVGPDYLDPGYHSYATGRPSRNLDTYLLGKEGIFEIYLRNAKEAQISIIEGAMGLYDGKDGLTGTGSTAEVAQTLRAPIILVVDCRSMARSAAALIKGFAEYDPKINLAGVILNQLGSDYHEQLLREAIKELGIPVIGAIKRSSLPALRSRHLGLVPAGEQIINSEVFRSLAEVLEKCVDFDLLLEIACQSAELDIGLPPGIFVPETKDLYSGLQIAYAKDEVFSFYYQDALDYLEHLGARLFPFSPLHDQFLPPLMEGLIIGGGFPELYLKDLALNKTMLEDINDFARRGKPIYAESGGLIYLAEEVLDGANISFSLAGLIPIIAQLSGKLEALGYYHGQIISDNILAKAATPLKGHQFHYYTTKKIKDYTSALSLTKKDLEYKPEGFMKENIFASFLHQHWAGEKHLAQGFLASCQRIKHTNSKSS